MLPIAVSTTTYQPWLLAHVPCKRVAYQFGLVEHQRERGGGRAESVRHGTRSASPHRISLCSPSRSPIGDSSRPSPEIAPRLPIQFGAGSEALAVGRMQTIQGSPHEVLAQLRDYAQAGASEIVCLFNSPDGNVVVEQMEIMAEHVMPAL
jgi:alkanesulfonate monooxygenase SsuD/methylene tetrahydromethanopterin reductase-like flavin-dependent oxidoreductase (luciferase family)